MDEAPAGSSPLAALEPRDCLDCGRTVTTRFCPWCGQRQDLRPLSLHALIWELLIEILDSDARVWRTLRCLVREPGRLTLDWAAGRRMRHVPPFRLYLVLNVLVFLVFSFSTDTGLEVGGPDTDFDAGEAQIEAQLEEIEDETGPSAERRRDALRRALAAIRSARAARPGATPADIAAETLAETRADAAPASPGADAVAEDAEDASGSGNTRLTTDPEVAVFLAWLGIEQDALEATVEEIVEDPRRFGEQVYERLSTVMILLLPLLALAMSGLYLFSGRPYVVHLVGLAHLHAFFFLLLLIVEGFEGFGALLATLRVPVLPGLVEWAPTIGFTASFWYLMTWLRRLYDHGRGAAIAMTLVVMTLHLIGAALAVASVMIVTLLASAQG